VTGKAVGFSSFKTKGSVDVASPGSAVTATVKFTNTASDIESVKMLDTTGANNGLPSKDLKVAGISGKTFKIAAAHGMVVPGVSHTLKAEIKLKGIDKALTKNITVKPKQTTPKAKLSKKSVTLNRWIPQTGDSVTVKLTTPKNVKLGTVRLNQKSLDKLNLTKDGTEGSNVFKLVRKGENEWTICFADGKAPAPKGKIAANLEKSYTIVLEIWAEGTYTLGADGKPVALQAYNTKTKKWENKSKPTIVNVKINIK
jgi:hypothetical protein